MKVFYAAIRDLIDFEISDCVVIAKTYKNAERCLKNDYDKTYYLYEFELNELNENDAKDYFLNYPEHKNEGIYDNAPYNYAYHVFC